MSLWSDVKDWIDLGYIQWVEKLNTNDISGLVVFFNGVQKLVKSEYGLSMDMIIKYMKDRATWENAIKYGKPAQVVIEEKLLSALLGSEEIFITLKFKDGSLLRKPYCYGIINDKLLQTLDGAKNVSFTLDTSRKREIEVEW